MKTASTFAAPAAWLLMLAGAKAQQFVMYSGGTGTDNVERSDPILSPGEISQHVHQLFGSNAFAPAVSYASLQSASCTTVGDASGKGNGADNSIYWHPALFMEAKDGSGWIRVPTNGHKLYYKNAGTGTPISPFQFPDGFRMLAGNPFMREAASDLQQQNITQWICHSSSGSNQGTSGGFPTGVSTCDDYPGFNGAIHYPHCWNGNAFDQANPTAHVTYPTGDIENGDCPSSHPTRLPHIFMENQFDLDSVADKVKPDTFTLAMGDPTGYGWHADFFNGWKHGAIPELMNSCPQGEYGNEDIGSCPSFEASETTTSDCTLKTYYSEKVDTPGQNLPGCNPVETSNPAPFWKTAPLGTYSTDCTLEGSSGGDEPSGSSSSAAAPSSSATPESSTSPQSSSSSVEVSATTFATSTKASSSSSTTTTSAASHPTSYSGHSHSSGSSISCPASNGKTFTLSGKTFQVECSTDHFGGDLTSTTAHSLGECVQACANTHGCVDVSLSGVACYMKSSLGKKMSNSGVNGAKLVSGSAKTTTMEAKKEVTSSSTVTSPSVMTSTAADGDLVTTTEFATQVKTVVETVTAGAYNKRHVHQHAARHLQRAAF